MPKFKVYRREQPLTWQSGLIILAALVVSLLISAGMLSLQKISAVFGLRSLFVGAFGSLWTIEDCLIKAIPIYLCSLGVAIAFRLQVWNIGAEGQFAMGAIGASWLALSFPHLPAYVMLPGMLAAAFLGGGLWGMIPALLKVRMRANEIIVSLMLNYIAILILDYLVYGPWKNPTSFGFPMTAQFSPSAILGTIGSTRINWGMGLCVIFGVAVWIFFRFTRLGFELTASGENVRAARYARLPYDRLVILVMVLSGAMAGCAGFIEASANLNRLQPSIMAGYGYTAIVVAWLARLNPFYIGLASFLLAGLRVGVQNMQIDLHVPASFGSIMEGSILLTVLAGGFFIHYRIGKRRTS